MPRGNSPRQPSRSGRQEGARRIKKDDALKSARSARAIVKNKRTTSARPPTAASLKKPSVPRSKDAASRASTSSPVAPERVRQIIGGLDRLYSGVTCAL